MKKIIICDFNRTIYDPDKKTLIPEVYATLRILKQKGFYLILLSQIRKKSREKIVRSLRLENYFDEIILVPLKSEDDFKNLVTKDTDVNASYSIGDYIEQDMVFGKRAGLKTIRIAAGAFAHVKPKTKEEEADYEVKEFREVLQKIC